jgi:hypothetical protein
MKRVLTVALSALVLGVGAAASAQSLAPGYCGSRGDIANCLNRGIAEHNDAAYAANAANAYNSGYGSSGVTTSRTITTEPMTTTTTTTTTSRTYYAPPPYPGALR